MASLPLFYLVFTIAISAVDCNSDGDILIAWKSKLVDPNMVLQSWVATTVNPCTWFHITCNLEDSITRIDLGNAGLSGSLIPQLGNLTNLQYLELFGNKFSGSIPPEIGMLNNLVSLDLRLNSNNLTGKIPKKVIQLIGGVLNIMNVSDNLMMGTAHRSADGKLLLEK